MTLTEFLYKLFFLRGKCLLLTGGGFFVSIFNNQTGRLLGYGEV